MDNTNDTECYLRLHLLNLEGATPVVQSLFQNIADSSYGKNIDRFLNCFKDELEESGVKDTLFQADGKAKDVNQWDVSLSIKVLLNCCTLERKRVELIDILNNDIKSKGKKDTLSIYLNANKNKIDGVKGKLITLEQYDILKKTTKVNDLDTELIICVLLICGSPQNQSYLREICKTVLEKEIQVDFNDGSQLSESRYMTAKEKTVMNKKQDLTVFESQFTELYPKNGLYDFRKWDTNLMVLFVINVCERITRRSQVALKRIRNIRNEMVAHKGKAAINLKDFLSAWTQLYVAITTILTEQNLDEDDFEKRVKNIRDETLDIQKAMYKVKQQYQLALSNEYTDLKQTFEEVGEEIKKQIVKFNEDTTEIVRSVNTYIKDVGFAVKKFVEKRTVDVYRKHMELKCADVRIVVKGNDAKAVDEAHKTIAKANKNPTGLGKNRRQAIDAILEVIYRDGSTIIEVRKGSVIARVQFRNLKGVNSLLIFVDSETWTNNIANLARDLGNEMGQQFTVEAGIPKESLEVLLNDIEQKEKECMYEIKSPLVFGKALDDDKTNANAKIHVPELKLCKTFSVSMATDKCPSKIRACTCLLSGEIVICDNANNNIKLFNNNCTPSPEPMHLQNFPYDICLSAQNQHEVLITVPKERSILFVRVENSMLKLTNSFDVKEECFGICCWPNGIATTVAHLLAGKRRFVRLLDWRGTELRTFDLALSSKLTPCFVSLYLTNDGEKIIISDYGTSRGVAINRNTGTVEFVCKDKHINRVTNITADDEDTIYVVGNLSDSVHAFSAKGKLLGQVLYHKNDGLSCPSGMTYNRYSKTLLLQPDHSKSEMSVYQVD